MQRLLLSVILLCTVLTASSQQLVSFQGKTQGTYYIVKYTASDTATLQPQVEGLFEEIDQSLSLWVPGSLINQFNNGEDGVVMDKHMRYVLQQSLAVSAQTRGAFDITVKPLVDLWGFGVVRHSIKPTTDSIKLALKQVGYQLLKIKGDSLLKAKTGVQIDCNGVAQGYTTDCVARLLESKGIRNYLVDVGGELRASGVNPKGLPWSVGIERPSDNTDMPRQSLLYLENKAIATSGNYRRFFDEGKTRYAHTINPKTGVALHSGVISVTVIADNTITADAFDNALILWGPDKGLKFIKQHPQFHLEACYIYTDKKGRTKEVYTPGFFTDHSKPTKY